MPRRKGAGRGTPGNLQRATDALAHLMAAASSDDPDRPAAASGWKQSLGTQQQQQRRGSLLARKKLRKAAREAKKQNRQGRGRQLQGAPGAADSSGRAGTAKAAGRKRPAEQDDARHTQGQPDAARKKKRSDGGDIDKGKSASARRRVDATEALRAAEAANPELFQRLRDEDLLPSQSGSGRSAAEDAITEEEREIARMEKKLGIRSGRMPRWEEDGLGDLLSFVDTLGRGSKRRGKREGARSGSDNMSEDEEDGEGMDSGSDSDSDADDGLGDLGRMAENIYSGRGLSEEEEEEEEEWGEEEDVEQEGEDEKDEEEEEWGEEDEDDGEESFGEEEQEDESKPTDEPPTSTPAVFISRKEAYGDNVPGAGSDGAAKPAKYIPPALRGKSANDNVRLRRLVQGLFNRLSQANLRSIVKDLEDLFLTNSRNDLCALITTFVVDACVARDRTILPLLSVYTAAVAVLSGTIGMEVGAHFVQHLATTFHKLYQEQVADPAAQDQGEPDKRCVNLIHLFVDLYLFKIVHSTLLIDLLRLFAKNLTALDVELTLELVQSCGLRLRKDDPLALKAAIEEITTACTAKAADMGLRVKFMVEMIADLKQNRQKLVKDTTGELQPLIKLVRSLLAQRDLGGLEPLHISFHDLLQAGSKGRWWLVGSAWEGRQHQARQDAAASRIGEEQDAADDDDSSGLGTSLMALAKAQRMNTDVRRKIFCAIMSSEDYVDAFERLTRLRLKDKQDREVVRVLVDTCVQEKAYNPFYAHLGRKLCQHSHNNKITFQFTFWDRFKELDRLPAMQTANLMRLLADLIVSYSLSLSILKAVSFHELTKTGVFAFQLFFIQLLTHYTEEEVTNALERIVVVRELGALKTAIALFLKTFVRNQSRGIGSGGSSDRLDGEQRLALLKGRCRLARKLLARPALGEI